MSKLWNPPAKTTLRISSPGASRAFLLFVASFGSAGWSQLTGAATSQGTCNASNTAPNGTVTVTCNGVNQKLADQIKTLVEASNRDRKTLNEISEGVSSILGSLPLAEPEIRIEPDDPPLSPDQQGYQLSLENTSDVDVDLISVVADYFWAERTKDIQIKRILQQLVPCDGKEGAPLNAKKNFPFGIAGIANQTRFWPFNNITLSQLYKDLERTGHPGLPGIRIVAVFQRRQDQKEYKVTKAYRVLGDRIVARSDVILSILDEDPSGALTFPEIMPYMDSDDHWKSIILQSGGPGGITEVDHPVPPSNDLSPQ